MSDKHEADVAPAKALNQDVGYFEKDIKYDKSFYVAPWWNYFIIIGVFIVFFTIFSLIFWG